MKQEKRSEYNPYKERHTVKELCLVLFQMRREIAEDFQCPLTQEYIEQLPQLIRLVNEAEIIAMGLNPKIRNKFRLQVEENKADQRLIEDGIYYQSINGCTFDIAYITQPLNSDPGSD